MDQSLLPFGQGQVSTTTMTKDLKEFARMLEDITKTLSKERRSTEVFEESIEKKNSEFLELIMKVKSTSEEYEWVEVECDFELTQVEYNEELIQKIKSQIDEQLSIESKLKLEIEKQEKFKNDLLEDLEAKDAEFAKNKREIIEKYQKENVKKQIEALTEKIKPSAEAVAEASAELEAMSQELERLKNFKNMDLESLTKAMVDDTENENNIAMLLAKEQMLQKENAKVLKEINRMRKEADYDGDDEDGDE